MQGNHNARTSNHQYRNRNLRHTERLAMLLAAAIHITLIGLWIYMAIWPDRTAR